MVEVKEIMNGGNAGVIVHTTVGHPEDCVLGNFDTIIDPSTSDAAKNNAGVTLAEAIDEQIPTNPGIVIATFVCTPRS